MIGNALLLLYSVATTVRDGFPPETQQKYQLNLLLHHWPIQTWIAFFALINFLVVLHGAKLAIKKREGERDGYALELKKINEAKPRIQLREPNACYIETVVLHVGGQPMLGVPFIRVRFVNNPIAPNPTAVAKDVRAHISYFSPGNELLLRVDGRWTDSTQPSDRLASMTHLLETKFGIGAEHDLDIACRDPESGMCFAWNNDNYNIGHLRVQKHLLKGEEFRVEVYLRGELVDDKFYVNFRNSHDGLEIVKQL